MTPANSWNKWVGAEFAEGHDHVSSRGLLVRSAIRVQLWQVVLHGRSQNGIGHGQQTATGSPASVDPVETARSYQLVASKTFHKTDLKLTLGHETQSAEYGKIDPDTGLQFDLGPGRIRYLAVTLRQSFRYGSLQATFEQADARDLDIRADDAGGSATDRRSFRDVSEAAVPFAGERRIRVRGKEGGRERLQREPTARPSVNCYCLGVPNKEFRLALARPFLDGRINVGVNMMIASGWTGQTTENFGAPAYTARAVGLDGNRLVPANPVNEVVGVRIPSYASVNLTYRFGRTVR